MSISVLLVDDEEAVRLFTKIGHINFIANVAPMIGLLGTVSGMMFTFAKLASSATPPSPPRRRNCRRSSHTTRRASPPACG